MATHHYCKNCRTFYDVRDGGCPECGFTPSKFNPHLKMGKLNNQLFGQAEHAAKEKAYEIAAGI